MADVYPFQPYRYSSRAGALGDLVTQPYDKISPAMQAKYLAASPYNLVRVILGEKFPTDTDTENCYTRAAAYFRQWIGEGILAQDPASAFYVYAQDFTVPDTHERATRIGFIGLGNIGKPMAVNLARDGFDLMVHDLRAEPVNALVSLGAKAAQSTADIGRHAEIRSEEHTLNSSHT